MGQTGRAKASIAAAGLAMSLSGCMTTLQEDLPFVARLNATEAEVEAGQEAEAPRAGGAFSFFGGGSSEDATESEGGGNPFKGLFGGSSNSDDAQNADAAETGGGNPFKGWFSSAPLEEGSDSGEEVASSNPFKGLFSGNSDTEAAEEDTATRSGGLGLFGSNAQANADQDAQSVIISGLKARRSILPRGSAYDQVAGSVLAANARAAEAELRAARLRAVAASRNWLPRIGPNISLSSLGDFVASLVVEQVLFDNGRKKAERAFAAADVEVAAVTLVEDTNTRVFTALDLYLQAQEGWEKSRVATTSFNDMSHFEYIMDQRVRGGVSNRSDLVILRQKLAEIRSDMAAGREAKTAAIAELNAMSVQDLSGVSGITRLNVNGLSATPLTILKAEAEKERTIAEATMARASNLPGLKATGSIDQNGRGGLGLNVASDNLFGLGTGATLQAIEASKEGASRQVAQSREDSNRRLRSLEAKLTGVNRQFKEANGLTKQSKSNLDLFQAQYKAGTRQVMDVVGVYETYARQQQRAVQLKYAAARLELEIAREMGLLADGAAM